MNSDCRGKHGGRHRRTGRRLAGQHRGTAVVAGVAVVAAGVLVVVEAPTAGAASDSQHRAVVLVDTVTPAGAAPMTFDQSLKAVLDSAGIGEKTLPQLLPAGDTVGSLLAPNGLDVTTALGSSTLWNLIGLNNITLGTILTDFGLNPSETVDQTLTTLKLGSMTLDSVLTPLGIPSTQTTLGLAERFDVANMTLDQLIALAGTHNGVTMSGSTTLGQAMTAYNLSGTYLPTAIGAAFLVGDMTCPTGISSSMTLDQFINCITYDGTIPGNTHGSVHLTGSTTIYELLTREHFYATTAAGDNTTSHTSELIGDWTLGQILNFNSSTTVQQFVDNLHVNLGVGTDTSVPSATLGNGSPSGTSISDTSADQGSSALPIPSGTPADGSAGGGPAVAALPTLGSQTFGALLTWMNLNPNDTLPQLMGEVMVGSTPLTSATLQDALDDMLLNPSALGPVGSQVEMTTPLTTFFSAMGGPLATDTIDQLLNLG